MSKAKVPLSRLVVMEPTRMTDRHGLPVIHVVGRSGDHLTLCGASITSYENETWRPATGRDRGQHRCELCMDVEKSTQVGERKILRAMGKVGFH